MTKRETITKAWAPRERVTAVDDYAESTAADDAVVALGTGPHTSVLACYDFDQGAVVSSVPPSFIFESTGQAIHVAFTIMSQPAQQDSMMRKSLVRILDAMQDLSPRLAAWLGQLRGEPSSTVHFDGLSSNDVRAQCAMILHAVRTKLPDPEMWAVTAKYAGEDCEEIGPPGERGERRRVRYAYSGMKASSIQYLAAWLSQTSALSSLPRLALVLMVAKYYTHHARIEISFRDLAKEYGGNHMTYARGFKKVCELLRPLEAMAFDRLHPYFVEQGIVSAQAECAT